MARSPSTLRRYTPPARGPGLILSAVLVVVCLVRGACGADVQTAGVRGGLIVGQVEAGEGVAPRRAGQRSTDRAWDVQALQRAGANGQASTRALRRLAGELEALQQSAQSPHSLAARLAQARKETERVLRRLAELRLRTERIEVKLAYLEANRALGVELRHDLARLPDVNEYRRRLRNRQRELAELHGQWLDLVERRDAMADGDAAVRRALVGLPRTADRGAATRQARRLVASLRAEYAAQAELAQQLFTQLLALAEAEAALVQTTEHKAGLIMEHVLWVPSLARLGGDDFEQIRRCLAWLGNVRRWEQVAEALRHDATENAFLYGLVGVGALWWFWSLGGWRRRVHQIGSEALAGYAAEFSPTVRAGLLTVGLALALPGVLAFLAWRMQGAGSEWVSSLGRGLRLAAVVLLAADLCRQVCRRRGLAEAHFVWPPESVATLRRQLRWAIPLAVPLVVVVATLEGTGPAAVEPHRSALGRVVFLGLMCMLAYFFWRIFEPRHGVLAAKVRTDAAAWSQVARPYAALAIAAVPLVLAVLSAWGYHYTALKLAWRLQATVWLVLLLVLIHATLQRWLLVVRRKVAIEQARAEREAAQAALREQQGAAAHPTAAAGGPISQPAGAQWQSTAAEAADFAAASAQSKRLLHAALIMAGLVGLWWVWVDVLPALRYLNRWKLWLNPAYQADSRDAAPTQAAPAISDMGRVGRLGSVPFVAERRATANDRPDAAEKPQANGPHAPDAATDGQMPPAQRAATQDKRDGGPQSGWPAARGDAARSPDQAALDPGRLVALQEAQEERRWITVGDLLAAAVVLLVTWIAVRNLPGLLEIALWQRLPVDRGVRYALSTLTRYAIVLGGLLLALGTVGIRWQNVQWLVAAMTVGLAFGLQEIFANFVSGLILLFERPIRPGDVVTVGSVSGTVNRIRIRSTTITDWDRKELIVPNKEFITGQVVNWTLSDPTQRLVLRVGVAYGTDPSRAAEVLLAVARGDPRVLREPAPSVVFMGFGESSLDFDVRVFLSGPEQIMQVRHDLNVGFTAALREAGIEIPFPQRVVHLRGPLPALQRAQAGEGEGLGAGGKL